MLKNQNLLNPVIGIQYSEISKVSSISDGSTLLQKVIEFSGANDWIDLYTSPASIQYQESMKEVAAGIFFDQSLEVSFPGDDLINHLEYLALRGLPLIIRMIHNSGESKLLGSMLNPAYIFFDFGNNPTSTGFKVSFQRQDIIPAPWLEIESAPPPGG